MTAGSAARWDAPLRCPAQAGREHGAGAARAVLPTAVLLAVLLAGSLEGQVRVRTEVDTTLTTVGDRITLTVTVRHPRDARVEWPDSLSLAPFEVLAAERLPARTEGDAAVSGARLTLAAFELGELEIPPFEVRLVGAEGAVEVLETDRYGIEIVSVGADESGDIREIRGPLTVGVGLGGILLALLLLLVPALLVFMLYRRFRAGRAEAASGERGPPPRPAHELALEALAALEASPLLGRGQVKAFHIELSEIVRVYVERRYRVDALEMTTGELLSGLEGAGVDPTVRDELRRVLGACDLVKFAKARPPEDEALATLRLARSFVERTVPAVPIPDVDVAGREAAGADGHGLEPAAAGHEAVAREAS